MKRIQEAVLPNRAVEALNECFVERLLSSRLKAGILVFEVFVTRLCSYCTWKQLYFFSSRAGIPLCDVKIAVCVVLVSHHMAYTHEHVSVVLF